MHSTTPNSPAAALDNLLSQSTGETRSVSHKGTCCCGRSNCAYLDHNNTALSGLEKDLQSAAQIGQALLARHEAYMLEVEEERRNMGDTVARLERDKKDLEASNAKTIEENRYLLDQLEELNNNLSTSDAQVFALNANLETTRKELDKLTALAAQTSDLEAQLSALEAEQAKLQDEVSTKEEETQTAIQRWKSAERTIATLFEQIDRIETELRGEKDQHSEIMARLERRRLVERELDSAAGRLKGAAGAMAGNDGGHKTVVSNFVKEILQDNANLQLGIVELRDLLNGSNEEVESLREQVMQHQPILAGIPHQTSRLESEISQTQSTEKPFHVHHHYHAAPKAQVRKEKVSALRRPKKKRNATSPGLRTPNSGIQSPRTPQSPCLQTNTTPTGARILEQTSATIPSYYHSHRFSQTSQTAFSLGQASKQSSPPSSYREQSVFDTSDDVFEFSRPTTPASTTIESPILPPKHHKQGSDVSLRSFSAQSVPNITFIPHTISSVLTDVKERQDSRGSTFPYPLPDHNTIMEEPEDDNQSASTVNDQTPKVSLEPASAPFRPRIHRASSAESILSSRGVDVPKLRPKHSRLLSSPRTSLGASSVSVNPITSSMSAVGKTSKSSKHYDSSNYNRLLLAQANPAMVEPGFHPTHPKSGLSKKLGGWVVGKWGAAPAPSAAKAALKPPKSYGKPPYQEGEGTEGDRKVVRGEPTQVEPVDIDNTLLEEALNERSSSQSNDLQQPT